MSDQAPLKPLALMNFTKIDPELGKVTGALWKLVWGPGQHAIDKQTKYLLSLTNAVGAGRFRQATRELVKAYAGGLTTAEMDEIFTLLVWNQGAGHFASQIGPSPLFRAYQLVKESEAQGKKREEIVGLLTSKFGEGNPQTSVRMAPGPSCCGASPGEKTRCS